MVWRAHVWLTLAVSGRGEDEIVEAIDEALARSLLTEIPPPAAGQAPSYGFPYEALRRTVYESATLARRRLLHSRAADILVRRAAPIDAVLAQAGPQ